MVAGKGKQLADHFHSRWLALLVTLLMAIMVVSCASPGVQREKPPPRAALRLTITAARAQIARTEHSVAWFCLGDKGACQSDSSNWGHHIKLHVLWNGIWLGMSPWKDFFWPFNQDKYVHVPGRFSYAGDGIYIVAVSRTSSEYVSLAIKGKATATAFADAIDRLIYADRRGELQAARALSLSKFNAEADAWSQHSVKPKLSDAAERQRILAESALNEKDLNAAVDHYEAGVADDPMWPQGWYNAALIWAELKNFTQASWDMKHYLTLMPNASDASAARKQMIIWGDKSNNSQ